MKDEGKGKKGGKEGTEFLVYISFLSLHHHLGLYPIERSPESSPQGFFKAYHRVLCFPVQPCPGGLAAG